MKLQPELDFVVQKFKQIRGLKDYAARLKESAQNCKRRNLKCELIHRAETM